VEGLLGSAGEEALGKVLTEKQDNKKREKGKKKGTLGFQGSKKKPRYEKRSAMGGENFMSP